MKYNPKLCDEAAALPGLSQVHPATPAAYAQGWLELLVEAEPMPCVASPGMHAATLQPPAGAAGELTGPPAHAGLARARRGPIPTQGPHPGLGPRDQPRVGQPGRLHVRSACPPTAGGW